MTRNQINADDLYQHKSQTWVLYASETIRTQPRGTPQRLRLDYSPAGEYRVTLGDKTVYQGPMLQRAIDVYHDGENR